MTTRLRHEASKLRAKFNQVATVVKDITASLGAQFKDGMNGDPGYVTLRTLNKTDNLTGLLNERGLIDSLERYVDLVKRGKMAQVVIAFIDVNNMGAANTMYGHNKTDLAIKTLTDDLRAHIRPEDILARKHGDELVLVAPTDDFIGLRDHINSIKQEKCADAEKYPGRVLGFSIGYVSFNQDFLKENFPNCQPRNIPNDVLMTYLIGLADHAMYGDKLAQFPKRYREIGLDMQRQAAELIKQRKDIVKSYGDPSTEFGLGP